MSRLVALIDAYKDTVGSPPDSSIARAIDVAPQTINSWRKRGIRQPPATETLRKLAALLRVDYRDVVLAAVLVDIGLLSDDELDPQPPPHTTDAFTRKAE